MSKQRIGGIYLIQSISKPERIYVGSTKDFQIRWRGHKSSLNRGNHSSPQLQYHYNVYGLKDLVFEIIESGEYLDKNHLLSREQGWYDRFCFNSTGLPYFNCAPIAGSNLGVKWSDELKKKQSERVKAFSEKHPEFIKSLHDNRELYYTDPNNKKKHSDLMMEYYKDNPMSEETIKKRVESIRKTRSQEGYINPYKGKKRKGASNKGKKQTQEEIDKRVASYRKTVDAPDYINPQLGRKRPSDVVERIVRTRKQNRLESNE